MDGRLLNNGQYGLCCGIKLLSTIHLPNSASQNCCCGCVGLQVQPLTSATRTKASSRNSSTVHPCLWAAMLSALILSTHGLLFGDGFPGRWIPCCSQKLKEEKAKMYPLLLRAVLSVLVPKRHRNLSRRAFFVSKEPPLFLKRNHPFQKGTTSHTLLYVPLSHSWYIIKPFSTQSAHFNFTS